MINAILRALGLAVLSSLLFACASKKISPDCKALCEQRAQICQELCRNNCSQCLTFADQSAAKGYYYYKQEKCIEGGTIARDLCSYRDPLQCRKTTCNCRADYQVCIQACGGFIYKRLRVAPVC